MNTTHRVLVALNLPRSVPAMVKAVEVIVTAMTNNPWFPTPTPSVATLSAGAAALDTAETAAKSRAPGAVEARNTKRSALKTLVDQVGNYVQSVADAHPEDAATIIKSAGLNVRQVVVPNKAPFAATQGVVSGDAHLVAQGTSARAAHEWQWSLDGKTWTTAPTTLQAKTTISGLTPGALVWFRHRTVTKKGAGDWSQPIGIIVH